MRVRDCIRAASLAFRVGELEIRGRDKAQRVSHPRQAAMWLARKEGGFSYPRIARHFGLDHSTICHGVAAVEARGDEEFQDRLVMAWVALTETPDERRARG